MSENDHSHLWILDSERAPLRQLLPLFDGWARVVHHLPDEAPDWTNPPEAILLSADIPGGAQGETFAFLVEAAGQIPILAVTRVRSLAQAVAFFRAGAADYLAPPLDAEALRERIQATLERTARLALNRVVVELEPVDPDPGDLHLNLVPGPPPHEEDILAGLADQSLPETRPSAQDPGHKHLPTPDATPEPEVEEEPEPVDGLPIPSLWEELPCGLIVFDSSGNMVFSNALGLDMFGYPSLAELQEALENRRAAFAAHGLNGKAVPDNQWPHELAVKSRVARAALLSIERPDKRRIWLRIDCMPHLSDGRITRLSMTMVNLTGDIPAPPAKAAQSDAGRPRKRRKRGR